MKKVIIISDTHSNTIDKLDIKLRQVIIEADIVIHAGDSDTHSYIKELQSICKTLYAVRGNCDWGSDLPAKIILDIEGVKIGISHGTGNYNNIVDRMYYLFSDDDVDIVIFGHTHTPMIEELEGVKYINPGSTEFNRNINYNSYAEMIIENGESKVKICKI